MERILNEHYEVVVVGGGSAGIAAALAAAKNGARTLLVESGPMTGGDLVSGLPVDGCINPRGEWIVGGVVRELFDRCKEAGGYVQEVFDWRLMWAVCLDPEMLKLVIIDTLARHNVKVLLYTSARTVITDNRKIKGIVVSSKTGSTLITAEMYVDCSGDGSIAVGAGASYELGQANQVFQPLTLVYRIANVDYRKYLAFVRDNPDDIVLGESPVIDVDKAECARRLYEQGHPFAAISAKGELLRKAIASGEMFPTTAIFVYPTSAQRREVGINATRIANVNAMDVGKVSAVLPELAAQAQQGLRFLQNSLPGFEAACLAGVSPHVGVRETRRIVGEYTLTKEDVLEARQFPDAIAKGCHHVDIHGDGIEQLRIPVKEGRDYGIPYACLIPQQVENLLVAGRCLSSTREANGSSRVMGQCMATGEAAGTAAALCAQGKIADTRNLPIGELQQRLREQGAVC